MNYEDCRSFEVMGRFLTKPADGDLEESGNHEAQHVDLSNGLFG
jgi:hypothetical protein